MPSTTFQSKKPWNKGNWWDRKHRFVSEIFGKFASDSTWLATPEMRRYSIWYSCVQFSRFAVIQYHWRRCRPRQQTSIDVELTAGNVGSLIGGQQ